METQYRPNNPQQQPAEDIRVKVTTAIWGCATGMLGISIPMVGLTRSVVVPICVVAGASLATVAIWLAKGVKSPNQLGSSGITEEQFKALEERLANVEVISSFERGLHERTTPSSGMTPAPVPVQPVQPAKVGHERVLNRSLEAPPF